MVLKIDMECFLHPVPFTLLAMLAAFLISGSMVCLITLTPELISDINYKNQFTEAKCRVLVFEQIETQCCAKTDCSCDPRSLDPPRCTSLISDKLEGFCYDKRCKLSSRADNYGSRYCWVQCAACTELQLTLLFDGITYIYTKDCKTQACIEQNINKFPINSNRECWYYKKSDNSYVIRWNEPELDKTVLSLFIISVIVIGGLILTMIGYSIGQKLKPCIENLRR